MIPVQNVYYMLAYAFQVLNEQGYKCLAAEQFNNVAELCAAILSKGVSVQLKRGLDREYITETDALSAIRGKIDISGSIKSRIAYKKQLVCEYDDFSVNSYMNRVIKATIELLLRSDISKIRKKNLRKLLVLLGEIDPLDVHNINWSFQYNRNNQTYRMLVYICYLIVKGLLQTNSDGTKKLMDFIDEQRMSRLYERFILEYFRKEHPELRADASQIPWQLDDDMDAMLPVMQTDIMLKKDDETLIVDAKYYSNTTQKRYDVHKLHSTNLYQIFTYVKNKESQLRNQPHEVSGMLLYAKTDEAILPNSTYSMSGNRISVRTLDLDCDFKIIAEQLDIIASSF